MMTEIKETEIVVTEPRNKRLFVLKDEKGRYYSTCSRHHWTNDINSAQLRARTESIESDAKTLMRYKKKGEVPHLTTFERLYVQEVKITEVEDESQKDNSQPDYKSLYEQTKRELEKEKKINDYIKARFVECNTCTSEKKEKCLMFTEGLCEGERCTELVDLEDLINKAYNLEK